MLLPPTVTKMSAFFSRATKNISEFRVYIFKGVRRLLAGLIWSPVAETWAEAAALYYLTPSFLRSHFCSHPNVIGPLLLPFPFPPREQAHTEPSKHFDMRKESGPSPSAALFCLSLLAAAYVGHHDSLLYASKAPFLLRALSWALSRSALCNCVWQRIQTREILTTLNYFRIKNIGKMAGLNNVRKYVKCGHIWACIFT